jgi:thioredoxin 1
VASLEYFDASMANVVDVDPHNWDLEVLKADVLTAVDFWHQRCPWCLRLNPVIDELSEEYNDRIKFVRLNVMSSPENRQLAIRNGVMGTPTIVFFCEGRPVETTVGFMTKDRLKDTLENLLRTHRECVKQSTVL